MKGDSQVNECCCDIVIVVVFLTPLRHVTLLLLLLAERSRVPVMHTAELLRQFTSIVLLFELIKRLHNYLDAIKLS